MAHLDERAVACGYANYSETYVTYPPKGLLPVPGGTIFYPDECDVWYQVFNAALLVNPAFNMYRIFDTVRDFPLYTPSPSIRTDLIIFSAVPDPLGCTWFPVSLFLGYHPRWSRAHLVFSHLAVPSHKCRCRRSTLIVKM